MNKNLVGVALLFVLGIGGLFGLMSYLGKGKRKIGTIHAMAAKEEQAKTATATAAGESTKTPIQRELDEIASKLTADMRAEARLNLNMLGQLRAYHQMVSQLDSIAHKVDHDMQVIEEITKEEFQENVKLQASLFTGKKPDLVAKHMEEFPANRVGAILAKMKSKEASVVLDTWAKDKNPRVSAFYREVMSAYLNNRRFDENPQLFHQVVESDTVPTESQS